YHLGGIRFIDIFPGFGGGVCANTFLKIEKHSYWLVRFNSSSCLIDLLYQFYSNYDEWRNSHLFVTVDSFPWNFICFIHRWAKFVIYITYYRYRGIGCSLFHFLFGYESLEF